MLKMLVIGNASVLQFLIPALVESSHFPQFSMTILDEEIQDCSEASTRAIGLSNQMSAHSTVALRNKGGMTWRELIQPFELILYAAETNELIRYREILKCCLEDKKTLIPLTFTNGNGFLGPIAVNDTDACWESAWRRLHVYNNQSFSTSPEVVTMMSGLMAHYAGLLIETNEVPLQNGIYIMNSETLEGRIHSLLRHPLVSPPLPFPAWSSSTTVHLQLLNKINDDPSLQDYLSQLVSPHTGIFHSLEESHLEQIPLSVCGFQMSDPLSEGPSELLPAMICAGKDHLEARREAGLLGLQEYVGRLIQPFQFKHTYVGIGTTGAEALGRGLQAFLQNECDNTFIYNNPEIAPLASNQVDDSRCQYYMKCLEILSEDFMLGYSEYLNPFVPMIWVRSRNDWFYATDLNPTFALRRALSEALTYLQTGYRLPNRELKTAPSLHVGDVRQMEFPTKSAVYQQEDVDVLLSELRKNHNMMIADLSEMDSFLNELIVYGVRIEGRMQNEC
ncbi:hypothetical protein [Paenibacillus sp.]|uniref:hypothetical protein n=1 Tax=Paenibacillus sp. TaxID=58172 RepID=UPI0028307CD7|nr:hypothetical protein [Paenibacillus sp.]MDR0268062.1 hypothetical protein [Paenibacillus sp.]